MELFIRGDVVVTNFDEVKEVRIYFVGEKQRLLEGIVSMEKTGDEVLFTDKAGVEYLLFTKTVTMIEMKGWV
jgi:hypothetical protein